MLSLTKWTEVKLDTSLNDRKSYIYWVIEFITSKYIVVRDNLTNLSYTTHEFKRVSKPDVMKMSGIQNLYLRQL